MPQFVRETLKSVQYITGLKKMKRKKFTMVTNLISNQISSNFPKINTILLASIMKAGPILKLFKFLTNLRFTTLIS